MLAPEGLDPSRDESRRRFRWSRLRLLSYTAATLSAVLASVALAQSPPVPTAPPPAPLALAKDVWMIPGGYLPKRQPDGNTIVLEGPAGLVVMDTGRHRWQRQAILDFARARNAPIVAIVNSHWHLDHVSGNPDLKAAYPGVKVYASDAIDGALAGFLRDSAKGAREYLQSPDLPAETAEDIRADLATIENGDALKPDMLVSKSGTITLGGRKIEMNLALDGPTAGDVWIYDSASRIAAVGDLVTLPVPFLDTACVAGWESALAQVWATSFETLIPGHGKPMTRAEFSQYRAAFGDFIVCSNSGRDKAVCAAGWTRDAGPLIEANGMDLKRAEGLAAYYISAVLRPNGGNSKYCKTQG